MLRSCIIVYGYFKTFFDIYNNIESPVILIEPRNQYIDIIKNHIRNNKPEGLTLITKALIHDNKTCDAMLLFDGSVYSIQTPDLCVYGNNAFSVKKQQVYTTSLQNIINEYDIQSIKELVFNFDVDNVGGLLETLRPYNHIISNITITTNQTNQSKLFLL